MVLSATLLLSIFIGFRILFLLRANQHKKFNEYMNFTTRMREMSSEIKNQEVFFNFIQFLSDKLPKDPRNPTDLGETKKEIYERFGDHLPTFKLEYLSQIREEKLDKLLGNDKLHKKFFKRIFNEK